MKINYKIVSLVLAVGLIVTYAWHWEDIFYHNKSNDMKMGQHTMSNEEMMSNGSMNMEGMDIGNMNMNDMTMSDMLKMMDGKTGSALEKEFISGMIPHHAGAIEMSKKLLQDRTISAEMKKFAEDIITAQEAEIKIMRVWLETKYK